MLTATVYVYFTQNKSINYTYFNRSHKNAAVPKLTLW